MREKAISVGSKHVSGGLRKTLHEHRSKYLMLAPFTIIFLVFTVFPVVASLVLSMTSFNMLEWPEFVLFDNYINLFVYDDVFLIALKNTLFFAAVTGPVSYLMCFGFAWIINNFSPRLRALLTLIFYAPSISGNAYMVWKLIFSSDSRGYANAILMNLGILDEPILWLQTKAYVMPILIVVQLWLSLGVSFLTFIAGFQNVDRSLYEAGSIDGVSNRWQELWHITLPAMKPQLMLGSVMQITSSFSVGAISMELAGFPSVEYAGHTLLTHMQDYGVTRMEMGYASAIATVLFFMMVFSNLAVQKLLRKVGS